MGGAGITNVLVTGGARRIGRAIVEDLASNGFGVVVHCNASVDEGRALVADLKAKGCRAVVVTADLTDLSEVATLVERAVAEIGPVSILVNNASVFEDDTARSFDWDRWDRHFAVHLKAPVLLARTLADALQDDQEGLVVNLIDQRVLKPTPTHFSYMLSKSALWTATRTMAQTFAPRLRVNAIAPGPALRSIRQAQSDFDRQVDAVPLQRGPALEEFGATVRWLWQARSVTGQLVALDGGQHLAWETPDVAGIAE